MNDEDKDSLLQANITALSGTGCVNIWELRTAYDFLRERLARVHKDEVTTKMILNEVTRRAYAHYQEAVGEADQMTFDFKEGS